MPSASSTPTLIERVERALVALPSLPVMSLESLREIAEAAAQAAHTTEHDFTPQDCAKKVVDKARTLVKDLDKDFKTRWAELHQAVDDYDSLTR